MTSTRARRAGLAGRTLRLSFFASLAERVWRSKSQKWTVCNRQAGGAAAIAHLLSLGGDLLRELARGADDERRHALAVPSRGGPLNRGDEERHCLARAGFRLRQDVNACILRTAHTTYVASLANARLLLLVVMLMLLLPFPGGCCLSRTRRRLHMARGQAFRASSRGLVPVACVLLGASCAANPVQRIPCEGEGLPTPEVDSRAAFYYCREHDLGSLNCCCGCHTTT